MTPTIGIIGGGQLARMMHAAGIGLGLQIRLLAEGPEVSAAQVVHDVTVGDYTDLATVLAFARGCDVITFDHEHVPAPILRALLEGGTAVRPGPDALLHAQDKAVMRDRLTAMGIPCPAYQVVGSATELIAFADRTGWPVIAKTSRGGYDGKGVWKLDDPGQAGLPFQNLGPDVVIVAEEFVDFVRELSVLVARRPGGETVAYPVSETVQTAGVCTDTTTPAPGMPAGEVAAWQRFALRIAAELDVVGILAVELMEARDGRVVVNELAMRPHNTGHWSIDGARTSQFENHLRAVADLPLGSPEPRVAWSVMANILGGAREDLAGGLAEVLAADAALRVQLYGKSWAPGRKLGHVTALGDDLAQTRARARAAAEVFMGVAGPGSQTGHAREDGSPLAGAGGAEDARRRGDGQNRRDDESEGTTDD
ncbi:MAG: 5-(carboxyamino)imidazole ribonucleotide synthase [Propionicimonas sp.]|uniref:5-(carboxyamino)imidazole ribonucleotide synthase n=1 Tax=Propionicimonas sp. TaxID=1955623 RepID=UPI002B1E9CE6|nr:5-(carboxyamino)imidazole ribonucleotide synthase [Propionicimonas sp.]MEA4943489.1 5-(carboxyamino)imidazole ribonucleotide synthase [Propionicimonas sp.]MEA5055122.1 5-(carboxyamino)imidazole ribonucleotide synthase [Propionicimonas sp.]MEA5116068.1 5-(carboxyamino)imidazole ribonucleotide synthase [Propionicimonas sp.]